MDRNSIIQYQSQLSCTKTVSKKNNRIPSNAQQSGVMVVVPFLFLEAGSSCGRGSLPYATFQSSKCRSFSFSILAMRSLLSDKGPICHGLTLED